MKTLEQCYQEVYKKWSTGTEWMPSKGEYKRMDNEAAHLYAEEYRKIDKVKSAF